MNWTNEVSGDEDFGGRYAFLTREQVKTTGQIQQ